MWWIRIALDETPSIRITECHTTWVSVVLAHDEMHETFSIEFYRIQNDGTNDQLNEINAITNEWTILIHQHSRNLSFDLGCWNAIFPRCTKLSKQNSSSVSVDFQNNCQTNLFELHSYHFMKRFDYMLSIQLIRWMPFLEMWFSEMEECHNCH